jgi:hypothetical protein
MTNVKTLVIHPKDSSTTFLEKTYKNIPNKTVVTGGLTKAEVMALIASHDRIMMMGHGSPAGLFSVGQFYPVRGYIIDEEVVSLLRTKKDSVFIWCFASDFVKEHGLTGFSSGMFISEVAEAAICGVGPVTQDMVDQSNYLFVEEVGRHVHKDSLYLHHMVKYGEYRGMANVNPVAKYNHTRLAFF